MVVVIFVVFVGINFDGVDFGFEVENENGLNVVNLNCLNGVKVDAVIGMLVVRLVTTGAIDVVFGVVVVFVVVLVVDSFVGLENGAKVGNDFLVVISSFCSGIFLKQSSVCDDVV